MAPWPAVEFTVRATCYSDLQSRLGRKVHGGEACMLGCTMPDGDGFKALWAKSQPRHSLWKHLLDAAAFSLALPSVAGELGLRDPQLAFLVGLHDVGKASPQFQHKVPELAELVTQYGFPRTADAECRHERLTAAFIEQLLGDRSDRRRARTVALALAAHHGRWERTGLPLPECYKRAQEQLCALLQLVLDLDDVPVEFRGDLSALGMILAGRVVLCDWLASNETFILDRRLVGLEEPRAYFATAFRVAQERVAVLGFAPKPKRGNAWGVVQSPRPIQRALIEEDVPPGLVIIEAPMGEGKTEAAWILAEKWRDQGYRGTYMALPTMATSESLHDRYRHDYLQGMGYDEDVKLVHGMAWLRDEAEADIAIALDESADDRSVAASWFRPTRRAMLADHGVGTVDQAMLAAMNVRFGFLRLYGLTRRVLVIDEVHAYDAYMSVIIGRLLSWCATLRIPVVLLSATLSAAQRTAMLRAYLGEAITTGRVCLEESAYPLITVAETGKPVRFLSPGASSGRVLRVECLEGFLGEAELTALKAAELISDGGCCCVIVNTVRQAQAVFQALDLPETEKLLFHARFRAVDRKRVAERVTRLFGRDRGARPQRFVLVATQVVEQSLDVDFDHMITELAPVDLLLQRSGRLHRHVSRDQDPKIYVLTPATGSLDFGGTGRVYARKPLLRTLALLGGPAGRCAFRLPGDFRCLIERCYGRTSWEQHAVPWGDIREADEEWEEEALRLEAQARQFLLQEPDSARFSPVGNDPIGDDSDDGNGWRARTRLGGLEWTAVLVPQIQVESLVLGDLPMREVRELYRRSVKVPGYLPADRPAEGFRAGVRGQGRLHGLLLLPLDEQGVWRGKDEKGGCWEVRYDNTLGLLLRRV